MIQWQEWLYNLTLPSDYVEAVLNTTTPRIPTGKPLGLRDFCELYNITVDEDYLETKED